jgi:hypothetical protein
MKNDGTAWARADDRTLMDHPLLTNRELSRMLGRSEVFVDFRRAYLACVQFQSNPSMSLAMHARAMGASMDTILNT